MFLALLNCCVCCINRLQDLAGYGVYFAVGKIYASAFKGRIFRSDLIHLLAENGRHGKK